MSELKVHNFNDFSLHDMVNCKFYLKSEADELISTIKAERDEYRYNLSCARNEIHNLSMSMREDVKTIADLEEERRWRKFTDEKPEEKQWILVFVENPSKYGTYIELRRWDMGCKFDVENQELYEKWLPLPSAPKEEK